MTSSPQNTVLQVIKEITATAVSIALSIFVIISSVALFKIDEGIAHAFALAFCAAVSYGLYWLYLKLYRQVYAAEMLHLGALKKRTWIKFFLFALAALWGSFALVTIGRNLGVGVGELLSSGLCVFLVRTHRALRDDAQALQDQMLAGPPAIHQRLNEELDAWRETGTADALPMLSEIGQLSELIISEGQEDQNDRPEIEQFFSANMTNLITDLATLRKLTRGEAYLTDTQTERAETLRAQIEQQKNALQSLYQSIAG